MSWSLGDKIVPRLDGGQVGQSGDLSLAECMSSDKRHFTLIVKGITELEIGGKEWYQFCVRRMREWLIRNIVKVDIE